MKKTLIIILATTALAAVSCKKKGCTDPLATNYSEEAEKDDGSCEFDGNVVTGEITEDITEATIIGEGQTVVCGNIDVSASLEIAPGATIIMCSGAGLNIAADGYIQAIGTANKPIVIKGETESAGFWDGLAIRSNNPNNQFDYVTVKDGGSYWGYEYAVLYLGDNAKLSMKNSTVSNGEDAGMFVHEGATLTEFSNNTFSNNITGLNIGVKNIDELDVNSNYNSGNDNDFIHVRADKVTTAATWPATTTPYLFHGNTEIEAGVTVDPGAEIKMEAAAGITIASTGWFNAVGTSSNPISLIGRYSTPGYWDGIKFFSTNPNNELNYVNLSDGGEYWGNEYSNIYIGGSTIVDNCTISNANNYGIYVESSSTLTSGGSTQTTPSGVEANNTFNNNGAGPDANCTTCSVYFE